MSDIGKEGKNIQLTILIIAVNKVYVEITHEIFHVVNRFMPISNNSFKT